MLSLEEDKQTSYVLHLAISPQEHCLESNSGVKGKTEHDSLTRCRKNEQSLCLAAVLEIEEEILKLREPLRGILKK